MKLWYAVQTKPKREKDVQVQLERASFETFLPKMKGLVSTKPLFPSYLFIQADFDHAETHRLVRFTRGVRQILGERKAPHPVPSFVLETLREITRDGSLNEQELLCRVGHEVTVKRGILKDLQGIIEKNIPETGRVKVLFKWLHMNVRAEIKYTDLEIAA